MLDCGDDKRERRRRLNRERGARLRDRRRDRRNPIQCAEGVEYSGDVEEMLVKLGWLPGDARNRKAVGKAITALLAESAKDFC